MRASNFGVHYAKWNRLSHLTCAKGGQIGKLKQKKKNKSQSAVGMIIVRYLYKTCSNLR